MVDGDDGCAERTASPLSRGAKTCATCIGGGGVCMGPLKAQETLLLLSLLFPLWRSGSEGYILLWVGMRELLFLLLMVLLLLLLVRRCDWWVRPSAAHDRVKLLLTVPVCWPADATGVDEAVGGLSLLPAPFVVSIRVDCGEPQMVLPSPRRRSSCSTLYCRSASAAAAALSASSLATRAARSLSAVSVISFATTAKTIVRLVRSRSSAANASRRWPSVWLKRYDATAAAEVPSAGEGANSTANCDVCGSRESAVAGLPSSVVSARA